MQTANVVCRGVPSNVFVGGQRLPRRSKLTLCRAELETKDRPVAASGSNGNLPVPDWLPEPLVPALAFLNREDFKLQDSSLYKEYIAQYAENEWVVKSTGWKRIPEIINGRAAMLGFVAAAGAELFGAGPALGQLSEAPQPVLAVLALIIVGTLAPIYKGTQGEYLDSLRDTYSIPSGVFTEDNEKVHGRLAMLGLGGLILVELIKGSALL